MSQTKPPAQKHKVAVIGSGKWGTMIGKIIAENVRENSLIFDSIVPIWVFEEDVDIESIPEILSNPTLRDKLGSPPIKLSAAINKIHQNIKYLPAITLPENLIANNNLKDTVKGASILVFSLPSQYLPETLDEIKGSHRPYARGISCIKGKDVDGTDRSASVFSELIMDKLQIYCGTLSGTNATADDVARERVCEMTIGYDTPSMDMHGLRDGEEVDGSSREGSIKINEQCQNNTRTAHIHLTPMPKDYPLVDTSLLQKLFERPYFKVHAVPNATGVSR